MIPITGVFFCVLVFIFGIVVIITMQAKDANATIELAEDFKVQGRRYRSGEQHARQSGNYVLLGRDAMTHQPYYHPHKERTSHVLNLGPTRVGKSEYNRRTFHPYDIAYPDNANVFFDPQLDLTPSLIGMFEYYQRAYCIFPDAGYNPLGGEGSAHDRAKLFADLFVQAGELAVVVSGCQSGDDCGVKSGS